MPHRFRWLWISGLAVLAAATGAAVLLFTVWPFTRENIAKDIGKYFHGNVQIRSCRRIYLPHPGCVAEDVTLSVTAGGRSEPFFIARQMTVEGDYSSFLTGSKHVRIEARGLRLNIEPEQHRELVGLLKKQGASEAVIDDFEANDLMISIRRAKRPPLQFAVHSLKAGPLTAHSQTEFRVALTTPVPRGEVTARGKLGPWDRGSLDATPVSGAYRFDRADLGVLPDIRGMLASTGTFSGTMAKMAVDGSVRVPDFTVRASGHAVDFSTRFHADVDATSGNVALHDTTAEWGNTTVVVAGTIAHRNDGRELVKLSLSSHRARMEDLMQMAMHSSPTMTGPAEFSSEVTWPPGTGRFIKTIEFTANFGINNARFTRKRVQQAIDKLSERARGDKNHDPDRVLTDLNGHLVLRDGIATFTNSSLAVPAARVQFHGTCNMTTKRLNFDGRLCMTATVSQASTGIKSILLKVVDPFFKNTKRHAGADVPVGMSGTIDHPRVGLDLK